MAIGQVVLGLCDTIEHLSSVNAVKEKYYGTFYNNTSSIPDGSGYSYYKGALDNLATVLLNLAEANFSDEYRNGGTASGGNPSQRWSNAKNTCIGANAYNYYYSLFVAQSQNQRYKCSTVQLEVVWYRTCQILPWSLFRQSN